MKDIAVVYISQVPDDMSLAAPFDDILKKVRRNASRMTVTVIPEAVERIREACR